MNALVYLIPAALLLGGLGLAAFLWTLKSGQYSDLDGAAYRILFEDDLPPQPDRIVTEKSRESDNSDS
ncbi:MAG: cbb3-type cytochrome oxidase assembly protein CcoS [Rhodospirillaceae bacterium]